MNKLILTAFMLLNMVFSQTPYISGTSMSADNTSRIVTFSEAAGGDSSEVLEGWLYIFN